MLLSFLRLPLIAEFFIAVLYFCIYGRLAEFCFWSANIVEVFAVNIDSLYKRSYRRNQAIYPSNVLCLEITNLHRSQLSFWKWSSIVVACVFPDATFNLQVRLSPVCSHAVSSGTRIGLLLSSQPILCSRQNWLLQHNARNRRWKQIERQNVKMQCSLLVEILCRPNLGHAWSYFIIIQSKSFKYQF